MKIYLLALSIFGLMALTKFYCYKHVLRDLRVFKGRKILLVALLVLLYGGELSFFLLAKEKEFNHTLYLGLGGFVVLGCALFVACVLVDLAQIFAKIFLKCACKKQNLYKAPNAHNPPLNQCAPTQKCFTLLANPQRREFLLTLKDLGVAVLFLLLGYRFYKNACAIPQVRKVSIALPKLKAHKKIAMISDVHLGKALGVEFMRGIVERINALKPDIVVIVGDLVDENIEFVKPALLELNKLEARAYYVNGNHEYYHGITPIMRALRELDIKVLENENLALEDFNLAGICDLTGLRFQKFEPDIERAKSGLDPSKPSILLAHQPKILKFYDVGAFDLVLCGHTHAGQVFPLSFLV